MRVNLVWVPNMCPLLILEMYIRFSHQTPPDGAHATRFNTLFIDQRYTCRWGGGPSDNSKSLGGGDSDYSFNNISHNQCWVEEHCALYGKQPGLESKSVILLFVEIFFLIFLYRCFILKIVGQEENQNFSHFVCSLFVN